jgi:hypothetical protein
MVTHCANQNCPEQFRFLGEGKLFLEDPQAALNFNQQQLFERCHWLCASCARQYQIVFSDHKPVIVPRIPHTAQIRQSHGA